MGTWLVIVALAVAVLVFALVLRSATRARRGRRRGQAELVARRAGEGVAPRDELARNAGVASFGLNLPWRRPRGDSSGYRR